MLFKQLNRRLNYVIGMLVKKLIHPERYQLNIRNCLSGKCCLSTELKSQKGAKLFLGKLNAASNVHIVAVKGSQMSIGNDCFFNRNVIVIAKEKITIGQGCSFGPNVCVYDHDHAFGKEGMTQGYTTGQVTIGKNCWIGAGTIILKNTVIGDNCVIGAGCVVKGEIPANSLVTMPRELNIRELR